VRSENYELIHLQVVAGYPAFAFRQLSLVGINEWVTRIRIGLIFTVLFPHCKSVLIDG